MFTSMDSQSRAAPAAAPPPLAGRRLWRIAGYAALIAGLTTVVILDPAVLVPVAALFIVVVPCEKLFPRHQQRLLRPGLGTDLAWAIAQPVLRLVGTGAGIVLAVATFAWLPGIALRPLISTLPHGVRTVLGVVLFDCLAYWGHRWSHEVPFLWRFHSVHHSSKRLDWISGVRVHPLDGLVVGPAVVVLLAAGFGVRLAGALAVIQLAIGFFLHANVRWRLRILHPIVATPEFHHWHHSSEPDALNMNYATLLPIWDVVFGTYFMPGGGRRPEVYGTTTPTPEQFVPQVVHPFRGLRNPLAVFRHPAAGLRETLAALRRGTGQIIQASRRRPRPGSTL
jgi:sterol desaturase/sphingolipid hydroxylase (fatty acid hydroxylase superfamily)